jgi:hypothetical protein
VPRVVSSSPQYDVITRKNHSPYWSANLRMKRDRRTANKSTEVICAWTGPIVSAPFLRRRTFNRSRWHGYDLACKSPNGCNGPHPHACSLSPQAVNRRLSLLEAPVNQNSPAGQPFAVVITGPSAPERKVLHLRQRDAATRGHRQVNRSPLSLAKDCDPRRAAGFCFAALSPLEGSGSLLQNVGMTSPNLWKGGLGAITMSGWRITARLRCKLVIIQNHKAYSE